MALADELRKRENPQIAVVEPLVAIDELQRVLTALLAKLDADAGVTDQDYSALAPVVLVSAPPT